MSTNSTITALTSDGKVKSIYCHSDGYVDGVGMMLAENYTDQEKVDALMDLGDLSVLDKSIECPKGHSFNSRVYGYTVAYGRDRGERGVEASEYPSLEDALADVCDVYHYVWDGEQWLFNNLPLNSRV